MVSRPATWETTDLACDSHCHGAPLRYESSCNSALNDLQKTCLLCEPIAHRVVCVVLFAIIIKKSWGLSLISSLAYRSNGRFFLSFFLSFLLFGRLLSSSTVVIIKHCEASAPVCASNKRFISARASCPGYSPFVALSSRLANRIDQSTPLKKGSLSRVAGCFQESLDRDSFLFLD